MYFEEMKIGMAVEVSPALIGKEKMLDFATPRFLIVLTQSEKARLEQSTARHVIGYHTSGVKYTSILNPSRPFHKKSGKRYIEPIKN